jgi:hypothetical protein
MKRKKIYILVKNFSGVNQDVELFKGLKKAKLAFKEYTVFPSIPITTIRSVRLIMKNSPKQKSISLTCRSSRVQRGQRLMNVSFARDRHEKMEEKEKRTEGFVF